MEYMEYIVGAIVIAMCIVSYILGKGKASSKLTQVGQQAAAMIVVNSILKEVIVKMAHETVENKTAFMDMLSRVHPGFHKTYLAIEKELEIAKKVQEMRTGK